MSYLTANLVEIIQFGSEIAGVLDLPVEYWPQPGQYLPCQRVQPDSDILTVSLFRVLGNHNQLNLGPISNEWQPGDQIAYVPPQGHGFKLPKFARQVGLIPYRVSFGRLLSLVAGALAQQAAVSLFFASTPTADMLSWVPSSVEILPLSTLLENPDWPDYLAFDVEHSALEQVIDLVSLHTFQCDGEVLVHTPMPCRGLGECGVCAVQTKQGWKFACMDGPVFPLVEVCYVAR